MQLSPNGLGSKLAFKGRGKGGKSSPTGQFKSALASPKLDSSGFILLSMELLGNQLGEKASAELQTISNQYQAQNYTGAFEGLLKLASGAEDVLGPEVVGLMKTKSTTVHDDPAANESRRFYETRLATYLEEEVNATGSFRSLDGMGAVIAARFQSGGKKVAIPKVSSPEDAQKLLGMICSFNDNIEMGLKADSDKYQAKDRLEKPKPKDDDRLSRNQGVMKANAPNFPDLVDSKDSKNRVPERNTIDTSKDEGYSAEHPEVPMVASISGTTFTLVALLDDFMKANATDKNMAQNVNNIIKSFVAYYIKNGFHSYSEMMDVLKEENIQAVFTKYGVTVDMSLPDNVKAKANKDAQSYAKGVSQKEAMHAELTQKNPPENTPPPETGTSPGSTSPPTSEPSRPTGSTSEKAPTSDSPPTSTESPSALTLLKKGKVETFEPKPGVYIVFTSAEEMEAAVKQITVEKGATAFRKAGNPNTIEIYAELQRFLGVDPPLLKLLKKGTFTKFDGKPGDYVVFKNAKDMEAAMKQITAEKGAQAFRKAGNPNTIEIYAEIKGLLGR